MLSYYITTFFWMELQSSQSDTQGLKARARLQGKTAPWSGCGLGRGLWGVSRKATGSLALSGFVSCDPALAVTASAPRSEKRH